MRFLLALLWVIPVFAQQPEQQTKPEPKAEAPAPSAEQWLSGDLDFGYRWLTDVRGSFPSYRSVVGLGEGPKLNAVDFTIQDPKRRLFDRIDARGYGWGGDPYNTAHVGVRKQGVYDFTFDYRNFAYFSALPSFGNPLAPAGFNERSFDTHRRNTQFDLELFPGKHVTPYFSYNRNHGYGNGVTTYVQEGNEFAVPDALEDTTGNYRYGFRVEYNRWHVTVEDGITSFSENQQLYGSVANAGNRTTPFFGQALTLKSVQAAYGITGNSQYYRGMATASPFSWINFSAQFLYSQPKTNASYTGTATGNFALLSSLLFYSGQTDLGTGTAKQPHVTANAGFELRPFRRLRVVESWMTNRYHDAAFAMLSEQILLGGATKGPNLVSALNTRQIVNYNQQQVDVLFDLTSKITLRGGHRYVWGDATVRAGQLDQTGGPAAGELRRNVGLAGISIRPSEKLSFNVDYEAAAGDRVYFRTSLNDYHRMRARARYQAAAALSFQANFALLNNQNPSPDIQYDFQSRDNSLAVYWTPASGKRISVMGEYDRSSLRSSINYLSLPFLSPAVSSYRDNAHTASSAIDLALPSYSGMTPPKLTVGGSLFISRGSRASRYYQPLIRLSLPLHKHVYWNTEWRWYGLGELLYFYEGFRTHVFLTGLRVSR